MAQLLNGSIAQCPYCYILIIMINTFCLKSGILLFCALYEKEHAHERPNHATDPHICRGYRRIERTRLVINHVQPLNAEQNEYKP